MPNNQHRMSTTIHSRPITPVSIHARLRGAGRRTH